VRRRSPVEEAWGTGEGNEFRDPAIHTVADAGVDPVRVERLLAPVENERVQPKEGN
jgi:hypothetical protein